MGSHSFVSRYFPHFENKFLTKMGTALFSTSGMIKTVECFAVFTCLVIHRIGNRGSQVWFGTTDFEMGYKETRNEVDAEIRMRKSDPNVHRQHLHPPQLPHRGP